MTKVSEMVRSTSMPSMAAMPMSCSQARCARPSGVDWTTKVSSTIKAALTTITTIWIVERWTWKPFSSISRMSPPSTGCSVRRPAPCQSWT